MQASDFMLPVAGIVFLLAACKESAPTTVSPPPVPVKTARAEATPAPKAPKQGRLTEITLEALFPRQQGGTVLLYDARPSFVASFGRIPGSISWPRHEFDSQLAAREAEMRAAVKAGKVVVIYCTDAACPDARAVAERLTPLGHDVSILQGGFAGWKDAGMPTE